MKIPEFLRTRSHHFYSTRISEGSMNGLPDFHEARVTNAHGACARTSGGTVPEAHPLHRLIFFD